MTFRKFLKIIIGLLIVFAIVVGLTSINHPIILKWLTGSARFMGKPIHANVYTDGHLNQGIKIYFADKYFGSNEKAMDYIVSLSEYDKDQMLKFFRIDLKDKWIGRPAGTSIYDYDTIGGNLFQSEVGETCTPWWDDLKGFNFDPKLSFTDKEIKFNVPPNMLKFDSMRIELK